MPKLSVPVLTIFLRTFLFQQHCMQFWELWTI